MLTTKQKVLHRFWCAIIPIDDLEVRPQPFRLLGETLCSFSMPRPDRRHMLL
jgi:hypothetical protein